MKKEKIVIVGSGVGGATVAKDLAEGDRNITILEKGKNIKRLGTLEVGYSYDKAGFKTSKEGVLIYRTFMGGGSAVVSLGNGVRALETELQALGIDLAEEFKKAEQELQITVVPETHFGERTKRILDAAKKVGYNMQPMPKFIDFTKCKRCGLCSLGCAHQAKWSPLLYLAEAKSKGVKLLTEMAVEEVSHSGGKVTGVRGVGPDGKFEISAEIVILATGGIGTPIILQKSGITNSGGNLFVDLFHTTCGIIEGADMKRELPMAALMNDFHESSGFLLSPYVPQIDDTIKVRTPQTNEEKTLNLKQTIGIMTKIKDDCAGKVSMDGTIEKKPTESDQKKLDEGAAIAKEILVKVKCSPESVSRTNLQGAHPGGTAAIGKVVNANLETEIRGLFVSDASVLPTAPGAPPILTIIALSKRLATTLRDLA